LAKPESDVDSSAEPDAIRRRALFGRSKGKTLRAYHSRLIGELLPTLEVDRGAFAAGAPLFATPIRELWLEIGFGGGEHLAARARENPEVGFIGCEPFVNGVAKLLATIDEEGLANVRVRSDDATALIEVAPPASLSRVYLLYPDPWPKRRQNKRRFVSPGMIAALARVLKPGAELRFATDIDDYAGWTLRRFLASPEFAWDARRADDWRQPWEGWAPTRYEAKARAAGRASVYLTFRRR
jgi:tRNA (guanine-N7-)-methyltransferase